MPERLKRVLVANRGEIALRILRACFDEGIETVLAVSAADRDCAAGAARRPDRPDRAGARPGRATSRSSAVVAGGAVARAATRLHPGYGFLSERPELADACADDGHRVRRTRRRHHAPGRGQDDRPRGGRQGGDPDRRPKPAAEHAAGGRGGPRCGAGDRARAPDDAQGVRRRRRAWNVDHPRRPAELGARFDAAHREAAAGLRRRPALRRALRREGPARRGAGPRPTPTARSAISASGTARPSAATRRSSRRRPAPDLPPALVRRDPRCSCAARRGARLRRSGHRRVPRRRRARGLRLPRGQRARPGRAPGVPRWCRASTSCASSCAIAAGEPLSFAQDDVTLDGHAMEMPDQRRGPGPQTSCRRPARSPAGRSRPGTGVRVDTFATPVPSSRRTTTRSWPR